MTAEPTYITCEACDGTGQVQVRRYFRKLGHPAKGVLHAAQVPAYGLGGHDSDVYRCGCGTTTRQRSTTRLEWLLERGDHQLCQYLRQRVERGDYLP